MGNCLNPKSSDNIIIEKEPTVRKLLLLGAGDSGKTTLYKQVLVLLQNGFTLEDKIHHRANIQNNVIFGIKSLISATRRLNIPITEEKACSIAEVLLHINLDPISEETPWTPALGNDIFYLWQDEAIQKSFARRGEFQIIENFDYFMDATPRLVDRGYVPTVQDILMCRSKSLGIVETAFTFKGDRFSILDVGGQRTERKKWIHCFENVSAVLFVVSLSEYNQICYEDNATPRMEESLKLFNETCRVKYFLHTPIYLIMNKEDKFAEKVEKIDLGLFFPNYTGGCDYEKAQKYIIKEFTNEKEQETICVKILNATDSLSVQKCLESILENIMKESKD
jgi:GTPase SAR1 family protein